MARSKKKMMGKQRRKAARAAEAKLAEAEALEEHERAEELKLDVEKEEFALRKLSQMKPVAERDNDSLFAIDTAPGKKDNMGNRKYLNKIVAHTQYLETIGSDRIRKKEKPARKVKPTTEAARIQELAEAIKDGRLEAPSKREAAKRKRSSEASEDVFDVWDAKSTGVDEWVAPTLKKRKKNHRKKLDKPAPAVPNVEVAHPGTSYNPTEQDHQDAIAEAVAIEVAEIREKERITRRLPKRGAHKYPSDATSMIDTVAADQTTAASGESESESDSGSEDGGKTTERKTKKQRKKEAKIAARERRAAARKEAKKRNNDIANINAVVRDVKREERALREQLKEKREKQRAVKAGTKKRLGRNKYEPIKPDVALSEELTGTLRTIKPQGNLLRDRFDSVKKRNLIEVGAKQQKRPNRKWKEFEPHVYRNFSI